MKTKCLAIGISTVSVILLILASLTNVVGYQSVKSTAVNDSPLFQIRTQRATNHQLNSITSQYIGMGKGNLWQFPTRDNRTEQLKKTCEVISRMDDKTFARFTELCIQRARQDSTLSDTNSNEIVRTLNLLRTKPEIILNFPTNRYNQDATISGEGITICPWFPGCFLVAFIVILIMAIQLYITFSQTCSLSCMSRTFCAYRCSNN